MKLLTKEGNPMVEIHSLEVEGDKLVIKSHMMSNIRTTLYLTPENFWEGLKLCRKRGVIFFLCALPVRLLKGWHRREA
jgi:hypothetical protein